MKILGRSEKVDFPDLGINDLMAKIDTGAYTSSIDCEQARVIHRDGGEVLEFVLLHPGRKGYTGEKLFSKEFERAKIKNANGKQERYVVYIDMIIKQERIKGRFSLANRSALRYPVLVGRRLLREGAFMVDVRQGEGLPNDEEDRGL